MSKCYSNNNEYYEEIDKEEFISNLESDYEKGEEIHFYEADVKRLNHSDFVNCADSVIQTIQYCAYENVGDYSEDYLCDVSDKAKAELNSLISGWLEHHFLAPTSFKAVNVKEISIVIGEDDES